MGTNRDRRAASWATVASASSGHTQGSGKSLTMAFYAGAIIRSLAMENPTVVVLTDRNDLDDQLFGTFSRCQDLLRQPPTQAARPRRPPEQAVRQRLAAWSSPPSRSSSPEVRGDTLTPRCPNGGTSS